MVDSRNSPMRETAVYKSEDLRVTHTNVNLDPHIKTVEELIISGIATDGKLEAHSQKRTPRRSPREIFDAVSSRFPKILARLAE